MKQEIVVDEGRVAEINQKNIQIIAEANAAIKSLELAIAEKRFNPETESLLATAEHYGKEVSRALNWWVNDFIGPVCDSAHSLWKMVCQRRSVIADPLEDCKKRASLAVGAYRRAYDAHKAELERIEFERRKKEEDDRKLSAALELEKNGNTEEAKEVIEQETFVAPVIMPSPASTKGVATRTVWRYRILNEAIIPDQFWMIDEKKIAAHVRTHKDKSGIPGVQVFEESAAAFSSR